jgi:hypothetical protein
MPDKDDYLGEPIPFDMDEPAPKQPDASAPKPAPKDEDMFQPVSYNKPAPAQPASRIQTFESQSTLHTKSQAQYKRPLNKTGQGACRVKTFHAKLGEKSIEYLDEQINDWLERHPEVEVKFSTMTMGLFEAKRPENHLIISVWY